MGHSYRILLRHAGIHACLSIIVLLVLILFSPSATVAQVIDPVVSNNSDSDPNSLRWAITNATSGSTITFDSGLSGQTIRLTSGELVIDQDLTIDGSSLTEPITISGDADMSGTPTAGDSRIFNINASGNTIVLNTLVITEGHTNNHGAGILHQAGNLTIDNTTISGNTTGDSAGWSGGGIFHSDTLTVVNSTIVNNHASDQTGNTAGTTYAGNGGGIYCSNTTLTVRNSTITANTAGSATNTDTGDAVGGAGGGIYQVSGTVSIESSTIVYNSAGGATVNSGTENPGDGGGVAQLGGSPSLTLNNSIVAENFSGFGGTGNDIQKGASGTITRVGNNLVGNNDTVDSEFPAPTTPGEPNTNGDLVGTPGLPLFPQLQPLADNGGRTQTLMPYFDSIVVNAGDSSALPADTTDVNWNLNLGEPLPLDQTGNPRVSGGETDLGAFEYQLPENPIVTAPFNDPLRTAILNKIKKLKKKIKKLKKKGQKAKAQKLTKKLKKLNKKLAML